MRFDRFRLAGFAACALDHIGINGALGQPFCGRQFFCFGLKYFDKFAANYFAFLFGVSNTFEMSEKLFAGIDVNHLHAQIFCEHVHHHVGFVQSQQAVIDEHAGELRANRTMNQRGGNA